MSDVSVVKKRRRKAEGRLTEENKKLRNAGKSYVTAKNILVREKVAPKEEVICKCKYACKSIPYEQKLTLFNDFYSVDHCKQQNYFLGLIQVKQVGRRRHGSYEDPSQSRRQATVFYTVPNGEGDIIQVCKNTFCNIFGVSSKRCHGLVKLKQSPNPIYNENRGNKKKERKFTRDDKLSLIHI